MRAHGASAARAMRARGCRQESGCSQPMRKIRVGEQKHFSDDTYEESYVEFAGTLDPNIDIFVEGDKQSFANKLLLLSVLIVVPHL